MHLCSSLDTLMELLKDGRINPLTKNNKGVS